MTTAGQCDQNVIVPRHIITHLVPCVVLFLCVFGRPSSAASSLLISLVLGPTAIVSSTDSPDLLEELESRHSR